MPFCSICNEQIEKRRWVGHVRSNLHKNKSTTLLYDNIEIIKSAFKGRVASYRILATNDETQSAPSYFLNNARVAVKTLIDRSLFKFTAVKVNFELFSTFLTFKNDAHEIKSFCTKNFNLHLNFNFSAIYDQVTSILLNKIEEFQERDSGWTFLNNSYLEVNINKYQPLSGSSYVELPIHIKKKKACLNIQNKDNYCFFWCVTAALYPTTRHPERVSSYPHFQQVMDISEVSFPMNFSDISIFEKKNPNLSINVYGTNGKTIIGPLYKSECQLSEVKRINLLFIENYNNTHYCLIKDLSRLVRSQITKHHGRLHFCETCLLFFPDVHKLDTHTCEGIVTILPEKGSVIQFVNYARKQDVPFVIYADFETLLEPIQNEQVECATGSSTHLLTRHVPAGYCYKIISSKDISFDKLRLYRGKDCVSHFIDMLFKDVKEVYHILKKNKKMIFTETDALNFNNATHCHICSYLLWNNKVRDHCHLTGRYRGAAHRYCNLLYKSPNFIPIFFHNLSGYDCHLFIKELGERIGKINVIPKNKEKYISFTKFVLVNDEDFIQLRFLDSFNFMAGSLDQLARTMNTKDFKLIKKHFPDDDQFNLLTRKGVYPYDYITNWTRYHDTRLPSKECFHNTLRDESVSENDYQHAKLVWEKFNIGNLGEYTDLYLKTDVLLLADIFEKFRVTCKKNYKLDPAFYITAPSLSFDAMLLITNIQLELVSDLEIVKMIQSGIRGGLCMCSHRYAKANHKYMDSYDDSQPEKYIVYLDCNNLYGFSMCQYLPFSEFRFLSSEEIHDIDFVNTPDTSLWGYILEVDLLYPENLHFEHNDLPFCPEKCVPPGGKTSKLIPNLYNKYNYVIHYVYLKKCLEHGLILRKIHRVIIFRQGPYLKKYIDLNTELRKKAKNMFEQDFFKLLNNSVFGKTLENTEKRVNVQLVNQWYDNTNKTKKSRYAERLVAHPYFHSVSVFTENLVAIQMKPTSLILDKPIYIGFTVLELSKAHMYNFHYNVIKPFYKNRVQLCYTDTDSFIYLLSTDDFYLDMKNVFMNYFDTSNYDDKNEFQIILQNKKNPGLFKDEMGGKIILEFVGLRSKLYCIKTQEFTIKKAKGIQAQVIRNLSLFDYQNVLFNNKIIRKKNILFKSIKHEIFTQSVNKVALSNNDDKRSIGPCNIATTAWGNFCIFKG